MKGLAEVHDREIVTVGEIVRAAKFASLPVEGCLHGILNRKATTGDPEVMREPIGSHVGRKGPNELGHL